MYDLVPTATKLYATLLQADEPLGRTELIEQTGISASSYDRRLSDVRALERVTAVQEDGHRRWTIEDTAHPKTPPVTAWLPANRGGHTATPPMAYQQSTTPSGPKILTLDDKRWPRMLSGSCSKVVTSESRFFRLRKRLSSTYDPKLSTG